MGFILSLLFSLGCLPPFSVPLRRLICWKRRILIDLPCCRDCCESRCQHQPKQHKKQIVPYLSRHPNWLTQKLFHVFVCVCFKFRTPEGQTPSQFLMYFIGSWAILRYPLQSCRNYVHQSSLNCGTSCFWSHFVQKFSQHTTPSFPSASRLLKKCLSLESLPTYIMHNHYRQPS